jgi:hypothetical protein
MYNLVILTEENGKVVKVALSQNQFVSESQSTEIHETEESAVQALLEYAAEGAQVAGRDLEYAQQVLA